MINNILITRLSRMLKKDIPPRMCNSKWFYVDITEKCECKTKCKFDNLKSKSDWENHANKNYQELLKNNVKFQNYLNY